MILKQSHWRKSTWASYLLADSEKMLKGWRASQEAAQEQSKPIQHELDQVNAMIADNETRLAKLLDLYFEGSFQIDVLNEKKVKLETAVSDLKRRQKQLNIELSQMIITDDQVADFIQFTESIKDTLDIELVDFEAKRGIIEALNLTAVLFTENKEKKIKIICYADETVVNYVGTSHGIINWQTQNLVQSKTA